MVGWDHEVSATPEELRIICNENKRISLALGNKSIVAPESKKIKQWFRRSIVLAKDLKAGHRIKESDLDFKRPGTCLAPGKISRIVGKITKKILLRDSILSFQDIS